MKRQGVHTTNPTNRLKIPSEDIDISVEKNSLGEEFLRVDVQKLNKCLFALELDKPAYKVSFYVSAHHTEKEFSFGNVTKMCLPKDLSLTGLDKERNKVFRLVVFDEQHKIVASNDRLKFKNPEDSEDAESLLNVHLVDLGERIWSLNLEQDCGPTLYLNSRIENIKTVIKERNELMGSILPQVLRDSLIHLAFHKKFDQDDKSSFQYNWKRFIELEGFDYEELPDMESDGCYYELRRFVEEVVTRHCFQKKYSTILIKELEERS